MKKAIVLITHVAIIGEDKITSALQKIAKQTTPKFVSIRNYENKQGEVSNYVLNLGVDYGRCKAKDIETLKNSDLKNVRFDGFQTALCAEQARESLLYSMTHATTQSKAQTDAYFTIAPNIRLHLASRKLMVYGFKVSKTVIKEGKYKPVNSAFLTLAKDAIRKELLTSNFRQFDLDKIKEVRMNGETLEIDL